MAEKYYTKVEESRTYKLRCPGVADNYISLYFTIVGDQVPVAFFINSRAMESFQWITGTMTSWSRLLEAGVTIESLIVDMKETFQPGGDYIIPDGSGRKVNSIVHHLGLILEQHIKEFVK